MSNLSPEERAEFESIAVVQSQKIWERKRDEINVGIERADEQFLSTLQENGYPFSFNVDASPTEYPKPTLILMGRQDNIVGYRGTWELIDTFRTGNICDTRQGRTHITFRTRTSVQLAC